VIPRYVVAAVLGGVVTFGLFFLMQRLIAMADARPNDKGKTTSIEFVRLKKEQELQTKDREIPDKKPPEEPPPPPPLSTSQNDKPDANAQGFAQSFDLAANLGGPNIGTGVATVDTDTIPLVRIEPTYPIRAQERGIEGWVQVEFTISPRGTVVDPKITAYEPSSIFNQTALRAIRRWKYNPKIVNGKPVSRPGVKVRLDFTLDNV
jgi:protein TonB